MKKQMLKKVYAIVLVITLIGSQQCSSVLANDIAQIYSGVTQNTEIPDYDYWMAQTIMNGIDNNGNSLYSTFRSFSEPVYRQLGGYLLDDKPLVSISTAWSIYFNSEYRNQLTNMQKYVYEMLLMDYLKYDAFGEDKNKELTNSKTDFALNIYDAIGEELNDKKESYINNLPVKESKEICRRIETIYGLGEVLKGVNEGIKTTKELIDCMSEYLAVLKVKDDCVSLLKVMQKQVSVDGDFKKAISEVLNTIDGTPIDYESKKYGEYLWNKILDAGWSALEDSNPVLGALNWGMNGLDVCFNSQDRASNNLKLALLYTTDCYMQQGMFAAADSFRCDPNSENGKKFTYCFNAYIRFQMYANNYATTWLNNYLNGGAASDIINWIYHKENVSTATDLINICKGQNKYRQSLINNQLKYADIYFAKYKKADEEIIPTARQKSITVDKGKAKQFVIDNVLSGAKVVYSSSNNKVAYVNSKGVIKGVKSGTATITAKVVQNKKTYYVNLAVKVCDPQNLIDTGTCGVNTKWMYMPEKHKLIISGKGAMRDYKNNRTGLVDFPWEKYKNKIYDIEVKSGVTEISNYAFYCHTNVKSVKMADSVKKIGYSAFNRCKKLKTVRLSKNISYIYESTFSNCESLERIIIPQNVKRILNAAFCGCTNLKEVIFSKNLELIGDAAFASCSRLCKIVFPSSLKELGGGVFQSSKNIKQIYFKGDFPQIDDRTFLYSNMKVSIYYPAKKFSWKNKKNSYIGAQISWKKWNP